MHIRLKKFLKMESKSKPPEKQSDKDEFIGRESRRYEKKTNVIKGKTGKRNYI
jgi:hypothetical protein